MVNNWGEVIGDFRTAQRARGLAARTIDNRVAHLEHLARMLEVAPERVTLRMLRHFLGREGISDGTRSTERDSLRAFFSWMQEDELRDDDPTVKLAPIRRARGLPRPYSKAQVEAMLTTGAYSKTRAMILLGYMAGLRRFEIAKVDGRDFVLDVPRPFVRVLGKGGVERNVGLHPLLIELAEQMPREGYWFPGRGSRAGTHISPGSVSDLLRLAKQRAGIEDARLTPHSTRHAFATELIEAGATVDEIRPLMGHASSATTEIYALVSGRRTSEAVNRLPGLLVPKRSGRSTAA